MSLDDKTSNENIEIKDYEILKDDYPSFDLSFKVIVIGDPAVGKSCLSLKVTKNQFQENYLATVGFEFFSFNIKLDGKVIKLQIWDTCGQEIYRSLISSFYKNSSLALVVYSIDDRKSFEDIDLWLKDIKSNSSPDIKIFIIGNKSDLEESRVVTKEEAEKFKEDFELDLFKETSAKTGFNTEELFVQAAKLLYNDYSKYEKKKKKDGSKVKLEEKPETKPVKKGCCNA